MRTGQYGRFALNKCLITGKEVMVTEGQKLGDSKGYWRQENIQLMLNWVFRDHKNPALQRFHAIPLQVSTVI